MLEAFDHVETVTQFVTDGCKFVSGGGRSQSPVNLWWDECPTPELSRAAERRRLE
jgi:hypothetical protein